MVEDYDSIGKLKSMIEDFDISGKTGVRESCPVSGLEGVRRGVIVYVLIAIVIESRTYGANAGVS